MIEAIIRKQTLIMEFFVFVSLKWWGCGGEKSPLPDRADGAVNVHCSSVSAPLSKGVLRALPSELLKE